MLIKFNKFDILLISETHLNDKKTFKLEGYVVYNTNHPDGTSHGGTAIIIKNNIKHNLHSKTKTEFLQSTTVTVWDKHGPFNVSAIYCPPRFKISDSMFAEYFGGLGNRFISGGDWNSKHTHWGSRLITTRGRDLKKCIDKYSLSILSTGEPTYWPTDQCKIPDLLDFFVTKGINHLYCKVESCHDTTSDHTPVIATLSNSIIQREQEIKLYNNRTDWTAFAEYLEAKIDLKIRLKSKEDIDNAAIYITNKIQEAAWRSTPYLNAKETIPNIPLEIRLKVGEKRKVRRQWQLSRHPSDKRKLNNISKTLKNLIRSNKNETLKEKLASLSATKKDNYSLWKVTKELKRPKQHIPPLRTPTGGWAKMSCEKAELFAKYLSEVFKPNDSSMLGFENEIDSAINSDQQLSLPLKNVTPGEVRKTLRNLKSKKAPGFDLITAEVLVQLPRKGIIFLTILYNAILRVHHFPRCWKISQVCMTAKPGKPETEISSYRPISLLPLISKVFEKILLQRLKPFLEERNIIPEHQFGFREKHSTVEQVHRVVHRIRKSLEEKEYCSAVFLDIQQAFDKVWHKGLLYKLKTMLPNSLFMILKSYLEERMFRVKYDQECSQLYEVTASVPQGSVLGPILYSIYTSDLPITEDVETATFADDTACLASDKDPEKASEKLQTHINKINDWLSKWRIKSSAMKSNHITFTLRKGDCPQITLGGERLPKQNCVKYLGMHLDRRMTWSNHIKAKKTEANIQLNNLIWLIGQQSPLSMNNKLLVYNSVIKPIWSYGIELWGAASNSNLEILQRFQNKCLRIITKAPWFTKTEELHDYLQVPTIRCEVERFSTKYQKRLQIHSNKLARNLLQPNQFVHRLKRKPILAIK